jgi:hypothetical protein
MLTTRSLELFGDKKQIQNLPSSKNDRIVGLGLRTARRVLKCIRRYVND